MSQFIILFLLFGLPFVYTPWISLGFEPPKVFVFEVLTELLVLLLIWRNKVKDNKPHLLPVFTIICIALISILHFIFHHQSSALYGNQFRLQGAFLIWHLFIFAMISGRYILKTLPKYITVVSILGLLVFSLVMGMNVSNRAIGTLGEPNALAATAIFLLSFIFFEKKRFIQIAVVFASIAIIFLTGSRSAFIALAIQTIFVLLHYRLKVSLKFATCVALTLLVLSYVFPLLEKSRVYENRAEIWYTGVITVLNNPLGVGFGNITESLKVTASQLQNPIRYQHVDSAHNIILDFGIQGGILSIILFGALVFNAFKVFISTKRIYLIVGLLGLLTVASFNPMSITSLVALWWILGQSFNEHVESK